jgi:hypothetical protein
MLYALCPSSCTLCPLPSAPCSLSPAGTERLGMRRYLAVGDKAGRICIFEGHEGADKKVN